MKNVTDIHRQEIIDYSPPGEEIKRIGSSFFRGSQVNFNPYRKDFAHPGFLAKFLLQGWVPDGPVIDQQTSVTAFGSCFAQNITDHLGKAGYNLSSGRNPNIYISKMGEGLVNVHAIAQQFQWALEDAKVPEGLWHGWKAEEFGYDESIRQQTREVFRATDFFVITLGLSEVWFDELTGGVFWRAVPLKSYDPDRHKFRVCSVEETRSGIAWIYHTIRKHVPNAKVLFTLSPIPLAATFRPVSCITANSVSKAILRAALDEFIRGHHQELNANLFYFPSYEIITELFFAKYGDDGRHPAPEIIEMIMKLFEATYCRSKLTMVEIEMLYKDLRKKNAATALAGA